MLLDPDRNSLRLAAAIGRASHRINTRQDLDNGIAELVATNNRPILLPQSMDTLQSLGLTGGLHRAGAAAAVPISARGCTRGVLNLAGDPRRPDFGADEPDFLATLGRRAGALIGGGR